MNRFQSNKESLPEFLKRSCCSLPEQHPRIDTRASKNEFEFAQNNKLLKSQHKYVDSLVAGDNSKLSENSVEARMWLDPSDSDYNLESDLLYPGITLDLDFYLEFIDKLPGGSPWFNHASNVMGKTVIVDIIESDERGLSIEDDIYHINDELISSDEIPMDMKDKAACGEDDLEDYVDHDFDIDE